MSGTSFVKPEARKDTKGGEILIEAKSKVR